MSSSKKETKKTDMTIIIVIVILAIIAMLGGIWYLSYKTITDPGVQAAAGQALPLLLA